MIHDSGKRDLAEVLKLTISQNEQLIEEEDL
jgi:hypothetical protein